MASTNKTTNYELSQYIGTDKPTYLVDYNSDMLKIDTGIKGAYDRGSAGVTAAATAQTAAETADGKATNAATAAAAAQSAAEGAAATASTASGKADTAQTSADAANAATVVNAQAIAALQSYLDIKNYITPTAQVSGAISGSLDMRITVARNDAGSLAKIYGYLGFTKSNTAGNVTVTLTGTGLNPDSEFTISPIGVLRDVANTNYNPGYLACTVKSNGDLEFNFGNVAANKGLFLMCQPCIYFIKNFGDQPDQQ